MGDSTTERDRRRAIGKTGRLDMGNPPRVMWVPVEITDVRTKFGRAKVEVMAIGGDGRIWVDACRVMVMDDTLGGVLDAVARIEDGRHPDDG